MHEIHHLNYLEGVIWVPCQCLVPVEQMRDGIAVIVVQLFRALLLAPRLPFGIYSDRHSKRLTQYESTLWCVREERKAILTREESQASLHFPAKGSNKGISRRKIIIEINKARIVSLQISVKHERSFDCILHSVLCFFIYLKWGWFAFQHALYWTICVAHVRA